MKQKYIINTVELNNAGDKIHTATTPINNPVVITNIVETKHGMEFFLTLINEIRGMKVIKEDMYLKNGVRLMININDDFYIEHEMLLNEVIGDIFKNTDTEYIMITAAFKQFKFIKDYSDKRLSNFIFKRGGVRFVDKPLNEWFIIKRQDFTSIEDYNDVFIIEKTTKFIDDETLANWPVALKQIAHLANSPRNLPGLQRFINLNQVYGKSALDL